MAHVHEKIDFTVGVFVVYKDTVLIRKHDKYHIWIAVGGHVDLDEDPTQAAVREVKEEVGLDVELWQGNKLRNPLPGDPPWNHKELIPPVGLNRHNVSPTHEHVDFTYFARATTNKVIPENPDDEWRWFTRAELEMADLLPDIKFWATCALDTLGSV
jgi:8-oxo-dGTP pyrophosphatase MutT (NUDIX family)